MDQKRRGPDTAVGAGRAREQVQGQALKANSTRPRKIWRVLAALSTSRRWHRFQAERLLHDHCLHSTIAEIQRRYGLEIRREMVEVRGFQGEPVRVAEYWLEGEHLDRARHLIGTRREAA